MRDAGVSLNELVFSIVLFRRKLVNGFIAVASANIQHRALGEVVFEASGQTVVVAFALRRGGNTILLVVGVVAANREETAGSRDLSTEMEAVALNAVGLVTVKLNAIGFQQAGEVFAQSKDLGNTEVIVAAEVEEIAVRIELAMGNGISIRLAGAVLDEFISGDKLGGTIFAVQSDTSIAFSSGEIAFAVALVLRIVVAVRLEGVHGRNLKASKGRRLISNRIVVTGGLGKTEDVVVAAVKCISDAINEVIRAGSGTESAHAAEGQRTVVGINRESSLAAEDAVLVVISTVSGKRAVIGIKAAFELEADLQTVAEVFNALDAPTGAGINAALKIEGVVVGRRTVSGLLIGVVVKEAIVDNAVKRHVSGSGGTGKSAENSESSKSLFHDVEIPCRCRDRSESEGTIPLDSEDRFILAYFACALNRFSERLN